MSSGGSRNSNPSFRSGNTAARARHRAPHYRPNNNKSSTHVVPGRDPSYYGHRWSIRHSQPDLDTWSHLPGCISTYAGSGEFGSEDGDVKNCKMIQPLSLTFSWDGCLFVAERRHRIRLITPQGKVLLFAGSNQSGYEDGMRLDARFNRPTALEFDPHGALLICDSLNHAIRKLDTFTHRVTTLAGGSEGYNDGPANLARFSEPLSIAIAPNHDIFITEARNPVIRRITPDGLVSTFMRNPEAPKSSHLPAMFNSLNGLLGLPNGDLLVADVTPTNLVRIHHIAMSGSVSTMPIPADIKRQYNACTFALSPQGSVYFALATDCRIFKLNDRSCEYYAGSGKKESKNGECFSAALNYPHGLAFPYATEDLYFCDTDGHSIRKICGPKQSIVARPRSLSSLVQRIDEFTSLHSSIGDFDISHVSGSKWRLTKLVAETLAPQLLTSEAKCRLECIPCSATAVDAFLRILHGDDIDELTYEVSTQSALQSEAPTDAIFQSQLYLILELALISLACEQNQLASRFRTKLQKLVQFKFSLRVNSIVACIVNFAKHYDIRYGFVYLLSNSSIEDMAHLVLTDFVVEILGSLNSGGQIDWNGFLASLESELLAHDKEKVWKSLDAVLRHESPIFGYPTLSTKYPQPLNTRDLLNSAYEISLARTAGDQTPSPTSDLLLPNWRIVCDGTTFYVHDWVLLACWSYFGQVLDFGGSEVAEKLIEFSSDMTCLSATAMRILLRFFYTGHLPQMSEHEIDRDNPSELLHAFRTLLTEAEALVLIDDRAAYDCGQLILHCLTALLPAYYDPLVPTDGHTESEVTQFGPDTSLQTIIRHCCSLLSTDLSSGENEEIDKTSVREQQRFDLARRALHRAWWHVRHASAIKVGPISDRWQ